jgi:hypothetical protein
MGAATEDHAADQTPLDKGVRQVVLTADSHRDARSTHGVTPEEAVAPALAGTVARKLRLPGASVPTVSLIRIPVGWVLERVTTTLAARGLLESAYIFEPLTTPIDAGHIVAGPAFNDAVSVTAGGQAVLKAEVVAGLIQALQAGWSPLSAKFGTLAAFVSHAIPPQGSPDRDLVPELSLAQACHQVLSGCNEEARESLVALSERREADSTTFYANVLLDQLDDLASAQQQVLDWRLQRLSQLGITDLAAGFRSTNASSGTEGLLLDRVENEDR